MNLSLFHMMVLLPFYFRDYRDYDFWSFSISLLYLIFFGLVFVEFIRFFSPYLI
jgi:hypothetical protein